MGDILGDLPPLDIGAGGIVVLVVLLILMGRLVPRQQLLDERANGAKWQEAAEKWQLTATQFGMSMEKLLVYAETTNHAIVDIRELAQRRTAADQEQR